MFHVIIWAPPSGRAAESIPQSGRLRFAAASTQARSLSHWLNAVCYRKKELNPPHPCRGYQNKDKW